MQELLLLTLMSVLSPVSTQCTDQGEGEEVVEVEDQSGEGESGEGESDQEETGDGGIDSQAAPDGASASEKKEDKKEEIQAPNDFDFSGDEFNNNKEETGTGSIFGPSTFEATEGVKVGAVTVPAA